MLTNRPTWRKTLKAVASQGRPLLLPVAHDPLTARLIERAGFPAYQIGGFALIGANLALPDVDVADFGDEYPLVERILRQSTRPVLVDCDNGHGDPKMIVRVVQAYEQAGASALFMEDQSSPKKCGHMGGKTIEGVRKQVKKIRVAVDSLQSPDTFFLARTDAYESEGLSGALRRAHRYLGAGAHGIYFEGISTEEDLRKAGEEFAGVPLALSILEGHGKTPWLEPTMVYQMGYHMILFPTTVLFWATRAINRGLCNLLDGRPMPPDMGVTMEEFEDIVDLPHWQEIEKNAC